MIKFMKMFLFVFSNHTICYGMAFHARQKGVPFKHKFQLEIKAMKPAINDAIFLKAMKAQHVLLKNYIKCFVV